MVESEPIRAAGFKSIFNNDSSIEIVATDIAGLIADKTISIALIGLHNVVESFERLSSIRTARPQMRLILTGFGATEDVLVNAVAAGAKGYLEDAATPDQVERAIQEVSNGSIWVPRRILSLFVDRVILSSAARALKRNHSNFTDRERQVLKLLVSAHSNREIAKVLKIEERTVKAHVARLMRKVGVDNRIALSVHAVTHSLIGHGSSA